MTTTIDAAKLGKGLAHGAGRIIVAPVLAAALDAPETRQAVRHLALTTGITIGLCIAGGMVLGALLSPRKD